MAIENHLFQIPFESVVSSEIVENYFQNNGLKVFRWAIVDVENNFLTVSAAIKT